MHRKLENVFYEVRAPRLSFGDIGGLAGPKEKVREMVCLPLTKGKELRAMGVEFPAGVMLWGPLGLGITMLAEAAAKEAGVSFVYVSGQEMLGKADRMEQAFGMAVREAPAVFFISDVDWLCPRAGASYEWAPGNVRGKPPTFADIDFTERFLALLDGLPAVPEVRLVGSCCRIDVVDQAAINEKKRFNRKIFVSPPTPAERLEILAIYSRKMPLGDDVDLRYLGWNAFAAKNPGYRGIVLETAHPAKFIETVESVLPVKVNLPKALAGLANLSKGLSHFQPNFILLKSG